MAEKPAAMKLKKKKIWFTVLSSPIFGQKPLGETPAYEAEELKGRPIEIDLGSLVGDIKRQHVKVTFEITDVEGHNAKTIIKRCEMSPSFVRRIVRKEKLRIDESIELRTKDNKVVRIKPFLVISNKANSIQQRALRLHLKSAVASIVVLKTVEELVRDIVSTQMSREIRNIIKKIYPMKVCEIRDLVVLKKKAPEGTVTIVAPIKAREKESFEEEDQGQGIQVTQKNLDNSEVSVEQENFTEESEEPQQ